MNGYITRIPRGGGDRGREGYIRIDPPATQPSPSPGQRTRGRADRCLHVPPVYIASTHREKCSPSLLRIDPVSFFLPETIV